jgi:hypothetical protein
VTARPAPEDSRDRNERDEKWDAPPARTDAELAELRELQDRFAAAELKAARTTCALAGLLVLDPTDPDARDGLTQMLTGWTGSRRSAEVLMQQVLAVLSSPGGAEVSATPADHHYSALAYGSKRCESINLTGGRCARQARVEVDGHPTCVHHIQQMERGQREFPS